MKPRPDDLDKEEKGHFACADKNKTSGKKEAILGGGSRRKAKSKEMHGRKGKKTASRFSVKSREGRGGGPPQILSQGNCVNESIQTKKKKRKKKNRKGQKSLRSAARREEKKGHLTRGEWNVFGRPTGNGRRSRKTQVTLHEKKTIGKKGGGEKGNPIYSGGGSSVRKEGKR